MAIRVLPFDDELLVVGAKDRATGVLTRWFVVERERWITADFDMADFMTVRCTCLGIELGIGTVRDFLIG